MSLIKFLIPLFTLITIIECGVPLNNEIRPTNPNLLINKLQDTLAEIARGVDEAALETVLDTLKSDNGIDIEASDVINIVNNIRPPTDPIDEDVYAVNVDIEETPQEKEPQVIENIEKVEEVGEVVEPTTEETAIAIDDENDDMSSEAIRYNSKGESIENPKAPAIKSVACKDGNKNPLPAPVEEKEEENLSSSNEHGQRLWDSNGNSIEKSNDALEVENEEDAEESEEIPVKEIKKSQKINKVLNKKVGEMRDNQLNMRQIDSNESAFRDDDDIPVITIPMGQILKTYNQMLNRAAGVYSDETEEYSDEMSSPNVNFDDPHLKNILRRISNERKKAKLEQMDPRVRRKPAALRVFDENSQYSASDEDL